MGAGRSGQEIVPHFTGPIGTAAHIHMMTAFPGQVVMEYNYGTTMPPYVTEFVEFRDGKCWSNDRPGLGISLNTAQLTPIAEHTTAATGNTYRRRDGSPSHW